jgi:hypothetical protein
MKTLQTETFFSKLTFTLSSLCVLHCLLTPIVLVTLPTFATFFTHQVEEIIVLSVVPISVIGFFPVWIKHKNKRYLWYFIAGISFLLSGQYLFEDLSHSVGMPFFHTFIMIMGASFMAYATYKNRKHTHHCKNPHHAH